MELVLTEEVTDREVIELYIAKNRYLEEIKINEIKPTLEKIYSYIKSSHKEIIDGLNNKKVLSEELETKLKAAIEDYFKATKE